MRRCEIFSAPCFWANSEFLEVPLSFAGTAVYATYGDATTYLDAVQLNAVPTPAPVASSVPEPESYAMLLAGLGLLEFTARRRRV